MLTTYTFHPVTDTHEDQVYMLIDGERVKMHRTYVSPYEAPQSGDWDWECGQECYDE